MTEPEWRALVAQDDEEGWPMRSPGPKIIRLECLRILAEHESSWTLESPRQGCPVPGEGG